MADEIIGGYRLIRHIATGLASQVWEVVEDQSGRHFAMKLLLPERIDKDEDRNCLLHEAEVGLALAHENIIRIVKVEKKPTNPFFVMEFFPSGSLKARMMRADEERKKKGESKEQEFLNERAQDIFKQVATGLAFMNAQKWVHRDVKPDNILVNGSGQAKLIDFAIAQKMPEGWWARTFWKKQKAQGTRSYMSPEQIRGEILDGRADMYSFACSCYEVTTGRPPFRGATSEDLLNKHLHEKPINPTVHNPMITKEFGDLILKMLAKKRDDRPKDFHDVLIKMRNMRVYKVPPKKKPDA